MSKGKATYRAGDEESKLGQLPPGSDLEWIVIFKGCVDPETIRAPSAFAATKKACVLHQCEREFVSVGLLPTGAKLTITHGAKAPVRVK